MTNVLKPSQISPLIIKAVAYVRMSTEHQQYSTNNQMDVIQEYALKRGMEIMKVFSDEGKSGLNIHGRDSLGKLIAEVTSGIAGFSCILVYDVSRWGRFQDADESAHYEYLCKMAGISVHYCAEQFENDGSPVSTIVKGVKRAMAGEYSRELSSKVYQGACRLVQLGFRQGGSAGYGLRRMLVDQNGRNKGLLAIGEHKSIQTDRVILVPGPKDETDNVQWIYRLFVEERKNEKDIALFLNAQGFKTDFGRDWTRGTVHEVLTNEKYIGHNVYARTSFKLKQKHVINPPETWVRSDRVFEGIIDANLFYTAQGIILARSRRLTDDEMLDHLKEVLEKHGRISGLLIDEAETTPSSTAYRCRFGSLVRAYSLIGYTPEIDYSFIEENRKLRSLHPQIVREVQEHLQQRGITDFLDAAGGAFQIHGEMTVSIVLARCTQTEAGSLRWLIRLEDSLKPDLTIAVRMNEDNATVRDYYLLPGIDMTLNQLRMAEYNGLLLDGYRFDGLDYFYSIAERIELSEISV